MGVIHKQRQYNKVIATQSSSLPNPEDIQNWCAEYDYQIHVDW